MQKTTKPIISVQNDSFYNTLADLVHKKRLDFADAYKIKQYIIDQDLKTTGADKRVIEYIHKNLKDWHTLVTNTNASKIFLILNENAKNNFNLGKMLKSYNKKNKTGYINSSTVRYWVGHLFKLNLIKLNEFNYGYEKLWRRNDLFEHGNNTEDLVKSKNAPPKDRLKLRILRLTAYFCVIMLEYNSVENAKKKIVEEYSFMDNPKKKEFFLNDE